MRALDVSKYSIQYLYTRALEVIKERTGDEDFWENEVQWVLTVPAIWKSASKQFMRETAYQVSCYDIQIFPWCTSFLRPFSEICLCNIIFIDYPDIQCLYFYLRQGWHIPQTQSRYWSLWNQRRPPSTVESKRWESLLLRVVATMPQLRTPSPDQKHST